MYLDIVILRHLKARPAHGYELKQNVQRTMDVALHNNALYPALRRFEEAGAVRRTLEQQDRRPPRHVYELTDVGRELLHDMLAELPDDLAGVEEEFLTRLGMFDLLTTAERRGVLAARERALRRRDEHLAGLAERAARGGADLDWGNRVTEELRARVTRELAWLAELGERA